jgi:fatty acid desaturase
LEGYLETLEGLLATDMSQSTPSDVSEPKLSVGYYRQSLSSKLDPKIFEKDLSRLLWYFGFAGVSIFAFIAIVFVPMAWPFKLILGLCLGISNGSMGFATHEIFHGSVIKSQRFQNLLGFFGFLPFMISPTFWRFWHNRLHHGMTQTPIHDPDAFPTLKIYNASRFMKFMFPYTPGSGHKRSALYLFFWFSLHTFVAQIYMRSRNRIFNSMNHRRVTLEFTLQIILVLGFLAFAGPSNWLWAGLIPLFAQNYFIMSYIATNHNLSPLTKVNDPLRNSLTVTNHPWLEKLHLNFGYHVEHHIYPNVSGRHMKTVHQALKEHYPSTYLFMPKARALKLLYATPRIYKNYSNLVHPARKDVLHPTLGNH